METEFIVTEGKDAYKIVDRLGVTYGSYADEETATWYAELLNSKWEAAGVRP